MTALRWLSLPVVLVSSLVAQSPEQSVRNSEKGWSTGIVSADTALLDRVLAPDLIYNHSNGKTDTKQTYIDSIHSGKLKYLSVEYDAELQVRIYGDAAVLVGSGAFRSLTDGKENALHLRFLQVYIHNSSGWQMVAHQSAVLPAGWKP